MPPVFMRVLLPNGNECMLNVTKIVMYGRNGEEVAIWVEGDVEQPSLSSHESLENFERSMMQAYKRAGMLATFTVESNAS